MTDNVWWYGVVADWKHEPLNNNRTQLKNNMIDLNEKPLCTIPRVVRMWRLI